MAWGKKPRTPLDGVSLLLCDLDGVIYRGPDPIPHAVESLLRAKADLAYLTNNASRTPEQVAKQLHSFGLLATPDQVVTSPQAAMKLLENLLEPGSLVLAVGGEGLTTELEKAGYRITRNASDNPDAVVQGFSPDTGWRDLAEASFALQRSDKVMWVATNTDWTIPLKEGVAPGNGAMVSAVHLAVGRLATFAGKPERWMFDVARDRFQPEGDTLMIGDRLDTDIAGANAAGIRSALVLTGIDGAKQLLAADASQVPTYVLSDLRQLHEPYPRLESSVDKTGLHTAMVGKSVVTRREHTVRVVTPGEPIDMLRAGAALIHDSGLKIFGLDVDPQLYSTL